MCSSGGCSVRRVAQCCVLKLLTSCNRLLRSSKHRRAMLLHKPTQHSTQRTSADLIPHLTALAVAALSASTAHLMLSPARLSLLNPPNNGLLWKISASVWYTRPTACDRAAEQVRITKEACPVRSCLSSRWPIGAVVQQQNSLPQKLQPNTTAANTARARCFARTDALASPATISHNKSHLFKGKSEHVSQGLCSAAAAPAASRCRSWLPPAAPR